MKALALLMLLSLAHAGELPRQSFTADQVLTYVSPSLGDDRAMNQPMVIHGNLLLAGNAKHLLYDVTDPFAPELLADLVSEHSLGEAESHQVTARKTFDGRVEVATISGRGVDLWDFTDDTAVTLLATVELEGINYGDNSNAVWGLSWQGRTLYVGGTNTGLHVLDTTDGAAPQLLARVPTSAFGGVSAGPLWALGNRLYTTPPKDHHGISILDIEQRDAPAVLDHHSEAEDAYIGGFYGRNVHLVSPFRSFDVLDDAIVEVGRSDTVETEYVSFSDGRAWLGRLRPEPGLEVIDLSDLDAVQTVLDVPGRTDALLGVHFTDDQFSAPIGNLVVMCDDETRWGCVLVATAELPDSIPPEVVAVWPPEGASAQPLGARVGVSFSDAIDLRTVDATSWQLRPLGGDPLPGDWGYNTTVVNFEPHDPLRPDTTYELVVDGLTDLAGNPLVEPFTSVFSTGADVAALDCSIEPRPPAEVGAEVAFVAADGADTFAWDFGGEGSTATHRFATPGRHLVTLTVGDGTRQRSCTAIQVVHAPLLAVPPASSSTVGVSGGVAFVIEPDADRLVAVDRASLGILWSAETGREPRSLTVDSRGRIWVANRGDDRLTVHSPQDGSVAFEVPLAWGSAPFGVAAAGDDVWLTLEGSGLVLRMDGDGLLQDVHLPPTATRPKLRGISASDGAAWTARFVTDGDAQVYRVEDAVAVHPLPRSPGPDASDGGRGVPNYLAAAVLSPDGRRVAVPSKFDNVERGLARDGEPLNTENTVRTGVSILGADGVQTLRVDLDDHDLAQAVAWSPAGDLLFVASQGSNRIDVLDADTGVQVASTPTDLMPVGLAVVDGTLLVHESLGRSLAAFDVAGLLDGSDAAIRPRGRAPTVDVEPLDATVLLGKQIFHNANTRQMNLDGYLSCASCHQDGGGDGAVWDFTDRGEGLRNTTDLRGKAGLGHGPVHWTANFDEIQDFEGDIRAGFGGSGFLHPDDWLATEDALGPPKAGLDPRLDALAAYVTSLDAFPRSPQRAPDGGFTEQARLGRRVYETLDCAECHAGPDLTDSGEARHDVGTITDASGGRRGDVLDGLDTPTLLGLHATAPYLHDGSAPTLEATLRIAGHGNAQNLSAVQMAALVSLLQQLEDELPPDDGGCACSGAPGAGWLLLPLIGLRRRR